MEDLREDHLVLRGGGEQSSPTEYRGKVAAKII